MSKKGYQKLSEENTANEQVNENTDSADEAKAGARGEARGEEKRDEALGEAGKKALDSERAARKEAEKRLNEAIARLEKFEDAQRTDEERRERELEKLRETVEQERKRREAVERDLLVNSVADEVGLPKDLAGRLRGADRDELLADAKELKALLAPEGPRKPAPVPEAGAGKKAKRTTAEMFADAVKSSGLMS